MNRVMQCLAKDRHIHGPSLDRRTFQVPQSVLQVPQAAPLGQTAPHFHHSRGVIDGDDPFGPGRQQVGNQALPGAKIGINFPRSQGQEKPADRLPGTAGTVFLPKPAGDRVKVAF